MDGCCSNSRRALSLAFVCILLLAGCEKENVVVSSGVPVTNAPASRRERPLSPEMKRAIEMRVLLEDGEDQQAMVQARQLMRSKERSVRLEVVAVFGWLGTRALPELTEMMSDRDDFVQTLAQNNWKAAYDGLATDSARAKAILAAVRSLDDMTALKEVLIKANDLETECALRTLEEIIVTCRGKPASTCAKASFEFLTGEPWSSESRTKKIIETEKSRSGR